MAETKRIDAIALSLIDCKDRFICEFNVPFSLADNFETMQAKELLEQYGLRKYEVKQVSKSPRGEGFSVTLREPDSRTRGITLDCKIDEDDRKVKIRVGIAKSEKLEDVRYYAVEICRDMIRLFEEYRKK